MTTPEASETQGMSLRELVLELRADVKDLNKRIARRPTRAEVLGTVGTGGAIIFGLIQLLG